MNFSDGRPEIQGTFGAKSQKVDLLEATERLCVVSSIRPGQFLLPGDPVA